MKFIALFAIGAYQRHLSPRKGYGCAYRVRTGHPSCSALGYRAIRMYGVWSGFALLRKRFERCAAVSAGHPRSPSSRRGQRGFCDVGCLCDLASCDLASCDLPCGDPASCDASACGFPWDGMTTGCIGGSVDADCCDCGPADCGSRRRKTKSFKPSRGEKYVDVRPDLSGEKDGDS